MEPMRCWKKHGEANENVDDWQTFAVLKIHAISETPEQQMCVEMFVKLANTPPHEVPGWDEATKTIENNNFSMVWAAINRIWGKTWKNGVRWDTESVGTMLMASKKGKPKRKKQKKQGPPIKSLMFIQRNNTAPVNHVLDRRWDRNYTTYLKIPLLPIAGLTNFDAALEQRVGDFNAAIEMLCEVDRRTCLTPWEASHDMDPLDRESTLQNTRDFVKPYAENFYVARGKGGSYIRVRIRHDTAIQEILTHTAIKTLKKERGVHIYEDKIQAQHVQMVGWWASSINSRYGINDLEWAIKQQPTARRHNIDNLEIRIGIINNRGKCNRIPEGEEKVFAMHVYCEKSKAAVLRDLLIELYPAQPRRFYLMGRQMRFVPNIHMPAAAKPPGAFLKAQDLKEKQAQFLRKVRVVTSDEITKLHRPLSKGDQTTLVEMLTAWKSPLYKDENLFVAVEEMHGATNFHYLEKNEEAAEATVSFLGMILAKKYGPEVWGWFTETARSAKKQYTFIQADNLLIPNTTQTPEAEWNFGLENVHNTAIGNSSTRIEIGEIDLEQKERGRPLDDELVATMGMRGKDDDSEYAQDDDESSIGSLGDNSTIEDSLASKRKAQKKDEREGQHNPADSAANNNSQEHKEDTETNVNKATHRKTPPLASQEDESHQEADDSNKEKDEEMEKDDDDPDYDSDQSDLTTDSVSLATKRKGPDKQSRESTIVTPQKDVTKTQKESPENKKQKPTDSPTQNDHSTETGAKEKEV